MFVDFANRKVITHRVFAEVMRVVYNRDDGDNWVEMAKEELEKAENLPNPGDLSYIGFNTFSVMSWLEDCIEDAYPWAEYSSDED